MLSIKIAVCWEKSILADSLTPPLSIPVAPAMLHRSVPAWQPSKMELPITVSARCEIRTVIRFFICKHMTDFGWTVLPHPPYSPDLEPSDYHLFPKLKEHLGGMRFHTDDEVKEEVNRFLIGMAVEFYDLGIQKLAHRLPKCLDRNGDYVEK